MEGGGGLVTLKDGRREAAQPIGRGSPSRWVVAPSLTPESYNSRVFLFMRSRVVAPSLTPESYNSRGAKP